MTRNSRLAMDPVQRFSAVASALTPAVAVADLRQVIADAARDAGGNLDAMPVVDAVARHVALHSVLTAQAARTLVLPILQSAQTGSGAVARKAARATPNAIAAAEQAAQAIATSLPVANGAIELSDPVMLNPLARVLFASSFLAISVGTEVLVYLLGRLTSVSSAAALALMVLGVLSLVAVLVLVMGYKNVTIKGGTGAAPPAGSSSGS